MIKPNFSIQYSSGYFNSVEKQTHLKIPDKTKFN